MKARAPHRPFLIHVIAALGEQIRAVNAAPGPYTTGFSALERGDLSAEMREALTTPPPDLAPFAQAFARLADRIGHGRRLRADIAAAAEIQRAPPPTFEQHATDPFVVFGAIEPARQVGGDVFDIVRLDEGRLLLAVGDVCGKGIPASLVMCVVLTALQIAARTELGLEDTVAKTDDEAVSSNATSMSPRCSAPRSICARDGRGMPIAVISPPRMSAAGRCDDWTAWRR